MSDSPFRNGVPHGGAEVMVMRDGERWCNSCKQWRGLDWFAQDRGLKSGLKSNCRTCCTAQANERYQRQRVDKPIKRNSGLKKRREFVSVLQRFGLKRATPPELPPATQELPPMQVTTIPPREPRAPRPVTSERQYAKAHYRDVMRERLGFVPTDCEYQVGGGPVQRCPLYDLCQQLVRQREDVFCELSSEELGIPEVKPNRPEAEPDVQEGVLWADTVMHTDALDDAMLSPGPGWFGSSTTLFVEATPDYARLHGKRRMGGGSVED